MVDDYGLLDSDDECEVTKADEILLTLLVRN